MPGPQQGGQPVSGAPLSPQPQSYPVSAPPVPASPAAAGPPPQAWPDQPVPTSPAQPISTSTTQPVPPQQMAPQGGYPASPAVSGPPEQTSGPPQVWQAAPAAQTSGPPQVWQAAPPEQVSGPPQAWQAAPPEQVSGPPQAWQAAPPAQTWPPAMDAPAQSPPAQSGPALSPVAQAWNQSQSQPPNDAWQPRITPSPPRRSVVPVLIAALVAVLVAGPAGYFIATKTSGDAEPTKDPSPTASTAMPAYEANQLAANKARFNGDLAAFAEGWLPYVGGCVSDTDPGGDGLQQGEKNRISCRSGGLGISFVLYTSNADRDAVRVQREKLNADSGPLAPGVAGPSTKAGASGKSGNYVEYAFRDGSGKTIAGIWWDRQDLPVTAYVEATWAGDLRESWEPLRDIWQRRS